MSNSVGHINLRISKFMDGDSLDIGAIASLRLDKPAGKMPKREISRKEVIVPIGNVIEPLNIELATGLWSVSVELPWGDSLQEEFTVKRDKTIDVVMQAEDSPRENLNWHHYVGAVSGPSRHSAIFTRKASMEIRRKSSYSNAGRNEGQIRGINDIKQLRSTVRRNQTSNRNISSSENGRSNKDELAYNQIADEIRAASSVSTIPAEMIDFVLFKQAPTSLKWDDLLNNDSVDWPESFKGVKIVSKEKRTFNDIYEVIRIVGDGDPKNGRTWAYISGFGENRLISVPAPWPHKYHNQPDSEFEILIRFLQSEQGLAQLLLKDPDTASMLAYITNDRLAEAAIIAEKAKGWLFYKMSNPLAAAAGGYVMLATKLHSSDTEWRQWIKNLAIRFPDIPDGKVLEGSMYLNGPSDIRDFDEAAKCFKEAFDRGIPYFSIGLAWLNIGVTMLEVDYPQLASCAKKISNISRMVETKHPFTTLRLTSNSNYGEDND